MQVTSTDHGSEKRNNYTKIDELMNELRVLNELMNEHMNELMT